jgi:SAM-dependent methyltransferase
MSNQLIIAGGLTDRVPATTPWDDRVQAWEEVSGSPVFARLAARVLEIAAPVAGETVVDLGAGTGLLALTAAQTAASVIAVDYSQPMLTRLLENAHNAGVSNLCCFHADLRELPLADASADVVVSSYAFHHLDDHGKELALAEARRVLRPGGRLVICDMMFALSLRGEDRSVIAGKLAAVARKGPGGIIRIVRNAGRVAAGRWEHPSPPATWHRLLKARQFADVRVEMVENEAGVAVAVRPKEGGA